MIEGNRRKGDPVEIDGSQGEGGGQILRTSLTLAAITGRPVRISNIRSGRASPGLAPQHLTSVRAMAAVCDASVSGDDLHSQQLLFVPGKVHGGEFRFDVAEESGRGSAGSVILILQTVLLPLLSAREGSLVHLTGGTHVIRSPVYEYFEQVYLHAIRQMGGQQEVRLLRRGYYPRGGGSVEMRIPGGGHPSASPVAGGLPAGGHLSAIRIPDRGRILRATIFAFASALPEHIPQRMASRATYLLEQHSIPCERKTLVERGGAPGAGIFILLEFEKSRGGFAAMGKRGILSEAVAEEACGEVLEFVRGRGSVDRHLADQLLLPASLANGKSEFTVDRITEHLATNAGIIRAFLGDCVRVETESAGLSRIFVEGGAFV